MILLVCLAAVWAAGFVAVTVAHVRLSSDRPAPPSSDAIICLGAGMASSTSPVAGTSSWRRAETCAALYQSGAAPVVVFTGEGHEFGSAAQAMADVAIAAGMPADAVIVEPLAGSTIQNAAFAMALLPDDTGRLIVVSDGFHLPRAWVIFRVLGAGDVTLHSTGPIPRDQAFRWIRRESIAIWFNLWRAGLYMGGGVLGIDPDRRIGWFD